MASLETLVFGVRHLIEATDENGVTEAIVPDAVISEQHSDEMRITEHPVDVGAAISDHAYKAATQVVCTFGWSDSSRLVNSALAGSFLRGVDTIDEVYKKLVEIQDRRLPVRLSTARRTYETMLIQDLKLDTTKETYNAIVVEITFLELVIVAAQTVTLASIRQKNPGKTASMTRGGPRRPQMTQQERLLRGRR
jgi:hypothetical protein